MRNASLNPDAHSGGGRAALLEIEKGLDLRAYFGGGRPARYYQEVGARALAPAPFSTIGRISLR